MYLRRLRDALHKRPLRQSLTKLIVGIAVVGLLAMLLNQTLSFVDANRPTYCVEEAPSMPYVKFYDPPAELPVERRQPGSEARHVVLTVATKIDVMTCAHLTSAILSGVSPVVTGYTRKFSFHRKFGFAVEALDTLGLHDWDIVLLLDSDTTFTGEDVRAVMEEFDRRAPAHPDDINVRAVRRGEQWAPMMFHSEPNCYAPRTVKYSQCPEFYRVPHSKVDAAAGISDSRQWIYRSAYLNSGVILTRVWALREFHRAFELHTQVVPSLIMEECDQSVATGFYIDLLWNELRLGLLAESNVGSQSTRSGGGGTPRVNQFGLHYGLIAIDLDGKLVDAVSKNRFGNLILTGEQHDVHFNTPFSEFPFEGERLLYMSEMIMNLSHQTPLFSTRKLHNTDVLITPSLVAKPAKPIDLSASNRTVRSTFPLLIHTPGKNKFEYHRVLMPLSGWGLALRLVPGYRDEARAAVDQTFVNAVSRRGEQRTLTLGNVCGAHLEDIFNAASLTRES